MPTEEILLHTNIFLIHLFTNRNMSAITTKTFAISSRESLEPWRVLGSGCFIVTWTITLSVEWKHFLLFMVCFISFRFWLKKSIHMLAALTLILCYRKIECSWSEKIFITIYLKFLHLLSRNLSFYYKSDRWLINQPTLWSLNCANSMLNCDKKNWFILFRT